ncbi:hypothetical protein GCM10027299_49670 [Larkinella ripae]
MKSTSAFFLVFFLVRLVGNGQSQEPAPVSYSQEGRQMTTNELQRFYRYITRASVQEKTMVKLGIWPASDRGEQSEQRKFRAGFNAEWVVEQKLSPAFSFLAGFDAFWRYATYRQRDGVSLIPNPNPAQANFPKKESRFQVNWKAGFRYYYAMPARIRNGKSANNFSGNYVAVQVAEPLRKYSRYETYNPILKREENRRWTDNLLANPSPRLLLAYGIQRRLGSMGYADLQAGPEIQFSDLHAGPSFSFQLTALIGLGW